MRRPDRRAKKALIAAALIQSAAVFGGDFQVNSFTTNSQAFPAVSHDSTGRFVVVWNSRFQDGSSYGVFGKRFDSNGASIGGEFQINSFTTGNQASRAVSHDSTGRFVVVWHSNTQDGSSYGVFGKRFDSTGAAIGGEFQVNSFTSGIQVSPAVSHDSTGRFVVVWRSDLQDGSSSGVFGKRFNSSGAAIGGEFQVNSFTTGNQRYPAISYGSSFVVVWQSSNQDGSLYGVFGKRFDSTGASIGGEFQVNSFTTNSQTLPAVSHDSTGRFVVVWQSANQDGSSNGVFGKRFDSTGASIGGEFQVNSFTTNSQALPAVSHDSTGRFVVVWHSSTQDGSGVGVFGRRFDSTGASIGGEFQVNSFTTYNQRYPAISYGSSFVVVWQSSYQDGSETGVFGTTVGAPTEVALAELKAQSYRGGVAVQWRTGREVRNLGFNVYREEAGGLVRLNPSILAGSALVVGAETALLAGRSYGWWDPDGRGDSKYWLEDIDIGGPSSWHGPVRPTQARGPRPAEHVVLLNRLGESKWSHGLTRPVERAAGLPAGVLLQDASNRPRGRPIGPGPGPQSPELKLSIRDEGWYRLTRDDLVAAGFDPTLDPRLLHLFADGQEIPIYIEERFLGPARSFWVEFYALGIESPYSDLRSYFLTADAKPGLRIPSSSFSGSSSAQLSFPYTVERRDRAVYFTRLLNGDGENFFGAVVAGAPVAQELTVRNLHAEAGAQAELEVVLQGVTAGAHRVAVGLNGLPMGEVQLDGLGQGSLEVSLPASQLLEGGNQVLLTRLGGATDVTLVDRIRITYPHAFSADDNALRVEIAGGQQVSIAGFSTPAVRVMDVTDPASVIQLDATATASKSGGYSVTTGSPRAGPRILYAFAEDRVAMPAAFAVDQPSNWKSSSHQADLVILSRTEYFSILEPLAALRRSQGYQVELIDVVDLYDEFSFGQKTPQAIRDFLAYAGSHWARPPAFVLLAGGASYDPKDYLGFGDLDFVSTKLIDTAEMETMSDDWLVDPSGGGLPQLAIGRLPFRSAQQAQAMVAKLIAYQSSQPLDRAILVSDLGDTYSFDAASAGLAALLPRGLTIDALRRSELDSQTLRAQLLAGINQGPTLVNFYGHGSVDLWRDAILTGADAAALGNGDRLPLFLMMTCLNGYFAEPALESLAAALVRSPSGGAIAAWASSGLTEPSAQTAMTEELIRQLFGAQPRTLGEAMALAKAAAPDPDVRRTWILLGDPTLELR